MPLVMPSLFAAAPALVLFPSASSPDVVVAPALVPCPSASALASHLSSPPALVPCLSASSPAVIVASALIPCPSASALACHHRRCRHHRRQRTRPADRCRPPPPSPSRRRPRHPFNLRHPAPPQSLLPSSPLCRCRHHQISCFLGEVPFHVQRNHHTRK